MKRTISVLIALCLALALFTPATFAVNSYYPRFEGNGESIVDALESVGETDTSFTHREELARLNGVTEYQGTADQNLYLVWLLKQGRLTRDGESSQGVTGAAEPVSMPGSDLSVRELFGYEGRIYLVDRDQISLRAEPYATGEVLEKLERGTPILGRGLYVNSRGNIWIQTVDEDGRLSWVFSKYVKEHSQHSYIDLTEYGFANYQVCSKCGNVCFTGTKTENGGIEVAASDKAHIALAACSFLPFIGNICDGGDALLSLYEGDYLGFVINLAAMIPAAGYLADAGKTGKLLDTTDDVSVTLRVLKSDDLIEVVGVNNRALLNAEMDEAYRLTGDVRFRKQEGMAGHHIVEFSDKSEDAKEARAILEEYGIGLNSARNGVYLCRDPRLCADAGGALHTGRHVAEYSHIVLERLERALDATSGLTMKEQRDALIDALDDLARELMRNDLQLQKSIQKAA